MNNDWYSDALRYHILQKEGRIAAPWVTLAPTERLANNADVDKYYGEKVQAERDEIKELVMEKIKADAPYS